MLEINEFDASRPDDARTPEKVARVREAVEEAGYSLASAS